MNKAGGALLAAAAAARRRRRQFGLKLIANVTYGYTSAGFSGRMPCAELADAIVQARGRKGGRERGREGGREEGRRDVRRAGRRHRPGASQGSRLIGERGREGEGGEREREREREKFNSEFSAFLVL